MNFYSPRDVRLTLILFFTMLVAVFYFSSSVHAYIPSTQLIFEKTALNHGKGTYQIEQEVVFEQGLDKFSAKENWLIVDGGEMRVLATMEGSRIFRTLKKGRVYWMENGTEKTEEVSPDYFMSPFIIRTPSELKKLFLKWNILPLEAFRERKVQKDIKEIKYEEEKFVRLSRVAGTVTYAYGRPAPIEGSPTPGLWIEQDFFLIRKIRTPTGAEISADGYGTYAKNLWFPKSQVVTFNNIQVQIRVLKVSSVELTNEMKKQLEPAYFRTRPEFQTTWPRVALAGVVQEFYKRFR